MSEHIKKKQKLLVKFCSQQTLRKM